jgi:SAM-dependent methyltransferase
MEASDRLERERQFHDDRFGGEERSASRFYAINKASTRFYQSRIEALPKESTLLDYGCGDGAYVAFHAARSGMRVTAVDLSPVAIENAQKQAADEGLADRMDFRVMNAEALEFDDDTFDCVGGLGVIHHLDIDASMENISRVLKPEGSSFFVEPLGHNPAINAFRNRTPSQRTPDEHPLLTSDFGLIERWFDRVEATYFHLLGLLALPARNRGFFDGLVDRLDRADEALFKRVPASRKHAWMVGIDLSGPRSASAPRP